MKRKSRVFTLGVACFFCAITALGVVPFATAGAGILGNNYAGLNNTTGATAASNAAATAGRAQSADNAQNLTPQEQLLAGTLDLDPENDPVVYTTDYGLDIHWHITSLLPTDPSDIDTVPTEQKCAGYAYFNHADVNWVIIGYSNKPSTISTGTLNLGKIAYYYNLSGYFTFSNSSSGIWEWFANGRNTPAGSALFNDYLNVGKDVFYNTASQTISTKAVFPNSVGSSELEFNEVLCLAQNILFSSPFNGSSDQGNCYYNSYLMTQINDFYNDNLTDLPIVKKTLKTVWYSAPNGSNLTGTYKIFPLAGANTNESFYVLKYLASDSDAMKQSYNWWLRSGSTEGSGQAYFGGRYGGVYNATSYGTGTGFGVRPAFVLQFF